jgi:serine/threonine-protein kinase
MSKLRVGDMIDGRYRIDAVMGDGGMSSIYRATHTVLEQSVAIKVVAPAMRFLPGMVARFLREARAATQLKGQHVIRVFDIGTTEAVGPYMVMEYLEGRDLGAILRDGSPIPVTQAVDYIVQACEALAEAHGLGIIHRDLKPANLFVTRGTRGLPFVKLIDFGISRIDSSLVSGNRSLTSPGVVMGSPGYMAPEQMLGNAKIDARADIWGLGAVLYELITRRRPFDGPSLQATYVASMVAPSKPSSLREGLPPGLDDVILRCLKPVSSARFANVAQLAAALLPFSSEHACLRARDVALVLETARARAGDDDTMAWGPGSTASASRASAGARSRSPRRIAGAIAAAALAGILGFGVTRVVTELGVGTEAPPTTVQAARVPSFSFEHRVADRLPAESMDVPAASSVKKAVAPRVVAPVKRAALAPIDITLDPAPATSTTVSEHPTEPPAETISNNDESKELQEQR